MIPYSLVTDATIRPYCCVFCLGTKGPFVVPHRDIRGYGDVFLCVKCVRESNIKAGFLSREEAEEQQSLVELRAHSEKEIGWRDERIAQLEAEAREADAKQAETEDKLGEAHGRVIQLEGRMAENAKRALELVGGGLDAA